MKHWRLIVFAVPDRLGGLVARLGFRPTKKNPNHWWRVFDPAKDKPVATKIRDELRAAGLVGKWSQVEARTFVAKTHHQNKKQKPPPSREGFGGKLTARPISGSWRRRSRRA